jgi:arylsulfatase A-like enzyme
LRPALVAVLSSALLGPARPWVAERTLAAPVRLEAAGGCFPERPELPSFAASGRADVLAGGAAAERFCALAGDDEVEAGGGDDLVSGGDGADRLSGEAGADTLLGNFGNDFLHGGSDEDLALGGPGLDRLWGEGGADLLAGGAGADVLRGGDGDDRLDGGDGDDALWGERGADRLAGGPGGDVYFYRRGDGDDVVDDSAGVNRLVLLRIAPEEVVEGRVGEDRVLHVGAGAGAGTITLLGAARPGAAGSFAVEVDDRPNLVLIFTDDLGWGDLGAYGQRLIATPELDAIAEEGLRFTQFYSAAPHCQPARASLFTGLHTGHTEVRFQEAMSADGPLLSQLLQASGYATGMFGKWGMAEVDARDVPVRAAPSAVGFDAFAGQLTHRDAQVHYLDAPPAPPGTPEHPYYPDVRQFLYQIRDGRTVPLALPPSRYVPEELIQRALAFIGEHRDRPFFLYLPLTLPHAELVVPAGSLAPYLDAAGRSVFPEIPWRPRLDGVGYDRHNPHPRATYAGMVSRLSRDVGRLLARLDNLGLAEDTLVLLTSDNGPHDAGGIGGPAFFGSSGGLSGMKWSLREGGIRVPLIAWWPGHVAPGVTAEPAALPDLFATLTDLAGLTPAGPRDGVSLRPLLAGEATPADRPLYWETWNPRADYRQALRLGRHKLLRRVGGGVELYDLEADPGERHNFAASPAHCPLLLELKALANAARVPPRHNPGGRYDLAPLPLRCP